MNYATAALLLALSLPSPTSSASPGPVIYRWVMPIVYNNVAVAQAAFREGATLQATGLTDIPAVGVQIVYADLVVFQTSPLRAVEFKPKQMWNAMNRYAAARGRAKGMVTTNEGTIVVWWIQ